MSNLFKDLEDCRKENKNLEKELARVQKELEDSQNKPDLEQTKLASLKRFSHEMRTTSDKHEVENHQTQLIDVY